MNSQTLRRQFTSFSQNHFHVSTVYETIYQDVPDSQLPAYFKGRKTAYHWLKFLRKTKTLKDIKLGLKSPMESSPSINLQLVAG